MENAKFKGMVSALEKVAGENKRVTGLLLEKMEIIESGLLNILRDNDIFDKLERFDYEKLGIRMLGREYDNSTYKSLCYIHNDEDIEFRYAHELPNVTRKIGDHGYMTRLEVNETCEMLSGFIQNMTKVIQRLNLKVENSMKVLDQCGKSDLEILKEKGFKEGNGCYFLEVYNYELLERYFEMDADMLEKVKSGEVGRITIYIYPDKGAEYSTGANDNAVSDDYDSVMDFIKEL